jgi:hypothetical protein
MDERIDALVRRLLDMRGENRNTIIEGACRLFAECENNFRDARVDQRRKDEAAEIYRTLIRGRIVEQIGLEESAGNKDNAAHLSLVLSVYIANGVIDRPAHVHAPKP